MDYTDIPSFEFALGLLNSPRPEFFVARVMMVIFGYYFPARLENWCIVPEVRVVGGIPDLVVEKFVFDDDLDVHEMFEPRLAVELKSQIDKSTTNAFNQSIDAMKSLLKLRDQDSIFIVIMKGREVDFFEYYSQKPKPFANNDRHHREVISFNRAFDCNIRKSRPLYLSL